MLLLSSFVGPTMSFVDHVRIYCVKSQHYGQCFVDHSKALCVASMIIMAGAFVDLGAFVVSCFSLFMPTKAPLSNASAFHGSGGINTPSSTQVSITVQKAKV